jgi:type I restriction enzyme, R subunit
LVNPSEAKTRKNLIDPALIKAGWNINDHNKVGQEIPIDNTSFLDWVKSKSGLLLTGIAHDAELPSGISDYALYLPNGEIIAVVEAKRTIVDPRSAQAQTEFYVEQIAKKQKTVPFAFMTNGYDIYFWDVKNSNKRMVYGFFSPDDLENLLYLRENKIGLNSIAINPEITNRLYQQEAIKRVCEDFAKGKRKALIVMATGTGKTRTAVSIVDIFNRANQARKILFVADRDELVKQAKDDGFEAFLPDEPCGRIFHTISIRPSAFMLLLSKQSAVASRNSRRLFLISLFLMKCTAQFLINGMRSCNISMPG